jgi:hypothetical protein
MRIGRQAVLVVHGIGEQQPMETLRSFVSAVLPGATLYSKPDTISRSYELRQLSTRLKDRQRTDFFELYWADKVEGTAFRHVLQWLRGLLFRVPRRVPGHLRPLWMATWLLLVLVAVLLVSLYEAQAVQALAPRTAAWLSLLGTAALFLPHGFLLYYLGDAARYLSPSPQNVATRRAIRETGVETIRRLHTSGKYDRVIVVGHSLGSVIAYEIVNYYWAEVNTAFSDPTRIAQESLEELERFLYSLPAGAPFPLSLYRQRQRALWTEMRRQGHAWRITDLITLGSPLAHAAILLARDQVDLIQKVRDRELPTNPPQVDDKGSLSYLLTPAIPNSRGELVSPRVAHHAACFASVRWTNLYYPARLGLFGDLIGGALSPIFGEGIRDLPLRSGGWWRFTLMAHTRYWRQRRSAVPAGAGEASAALVDALDLEWAQDRALGT